MALKKNANAKVKYHLKKIVFTMNYNYGFRSHWGMEMANIPIWKKGFNYDF